MAFEIRPITLRQARAFVDEHHRHHDGPQGGKFALALLQGGELVGVAIAGQPVARGNDDGLTLEVTRVCVLDGIRNGCSYLYGKMRRAGQALGYRRIITYTLNTENGASLRAAGWTCEAETRGQTWNRPKSGRIREDKAPIQNKFRWAAPD